MGRFLSLLLLFCRAVSGLLDRRDQLSRGHFALLDGYERFVGQRNFGLLNSGQFGKCRLHFGNTPDGSGHSRDDQVDSSFRDRCRLSRFFRVGILRLFLVSSVSDSHAKRRRDDDG